MNSKHALRTASLALLLSSAAALAPASAHAQAPAGVRALILQELRVQPDEPTLRRIVESELQLRPGDAIDAPALARFEERLHASGQLDSLSVYTEAGRERGHVVLVVEAKLDRSAHLLTGFGHQQIDGWYLDLIGVRWSNPARRGGEARLAFRTGQRSGGIHGRLQIPRLLGNADFLLQLESVERRWRIHADGQVLDQPIRRGELLLGVGWGARRGWRSELWLGGMSAQPDDELRGVDDDEDQPAASFVPGDDERQGFGVLGLDLRYRSREDWRSGHEHTLRLRRLEHRDGAHFWRGEFESALALPLPGHSALALGARAAAVGEDAPHYERLIFGGTDSVRGFRDASLSGALGARRLWSASAEWRAPILPRGGSDPRVIGVLFADVGQAWDAELQASDVALGVGYGLRIRVPWIQILRIDAGIPLSDELTGDAFWVHSSLGFGF